MEIRVPEVGESVVEALVARWHAKNGAMVKKEQPLCELETDKVTLEINAEGDGVLTILVPEGRTVAIGTVIGIVGEEAVTGRAAPPLSPAARKLAREKSLSPEIIKGSGKKGRVLAEDLMEKASVPVKPPPGPAAPPAETSAGESEQGETPSAPPAIPEPAETGPREPERGVTSKPMTPIRRKIAERLTQARHGTAMVTTFNEADMGRIVALRRKYHDHFLQKHNVSLGIMSFFVKAAIEALKEFPDLNARIEGSDIIYHHFYDIGIAVSGEKGLVVPVLRNAERLHFAEIEKAIDAFVAKIRANRLELSDLEGGTFTISNGGIFGSLLSTPILNPPQSAVLGMHAIQDRPVALMGKVVIRPMMYLALSYDHRIVDGREAVQFLKKVKEYVEEPEEMMLEG